MELLGNQLDLRTGEDRLSFLLSLVQAYRLLAVMSAAVPQLHGRWPLYSEIVRENSMYDLAPLPNCNLMLLIELIGNALLMMFALHYLLQLVCTLSYTQLSPVKVSSTLVRSASCCLARVMPAVCLLYGWLTTVVLLT